MRNIANKCETMQNCETDDIFQATETTNWLTL